MSNKRSFNNKRQPRTRINQFIRVREVFLIGANGEKIGNTQTQDALKKAKSYGLDLVEVSPNTRPPVCKILDFGKYKYEMAKKEKEARKHNSTSQKVKELKYHLNIDEGDYLTKARKAEGFMLKGMKVKIMMVFRGREMQKKDLGFDLIKRIRQDLQHVGNADFEPKMIGRNINMMLTPLPEKKRSRKFTEEGTPIEEEDDSVQESKEPSND
ncbi:MAG: translation initiation factor IF-3 [Verrucomicrobiota bacterium]